MVCEDNRSLIKRQCFKEHSVPVFDVVRELKLYALYMRQCFKEQNVLTPVVEVVCEGLLLLHAVHLGQVTVLNTTKKVFFYLSDYEEEGVDHKTPSF